MEEAEKKGERKWVVAPTNFMNIDSPESGEITFWGKVGKTRDLGRIGSETTMKKLLKLWGGIASTITYIERAKVVTRKKGTRKKAHTSGKKEIRMETNR